jgi:hypothetical protein
MRFSACQGRKLMPLQSYIFGYVSGSPPRAIIFKQACALGCEGIVSKRLGSRYRSGRVDHWLKIKNPAAPAVKRVSKRLGSRYRSGRVDHWLKIKNPAHLARPLNSRARQGGSGASAQACIRCNSRRRCDDCRQIRGLMCDIC